MSFAIGIGIGVVVGWIVFKRPQWATDLINKIKAKFHIGTVPPAPPAA